MDIRGISSRRANKYKKSANTYEDGRPPLIRPSRELEEAQLEAWLEMASDFHRPDGAYAGLRIISCAGFQDFRAPTIPFTRGSFEKLIDGLRLPKCYPWACLHNHYCHFADFSMGDAPNETDIIGFVMRTYTEDITWSLALSYNFKERITNVIVRGLQESNEAATFPDVLRRSAGLAGHPMLVPLILADILTTIYEDGLMWRLNYEVIRLEYVTGYNRYENSKHVDPLELDFLKLTADLNIAQRDLGRPEIRLKSLQMLFGKISTVSRMVDSLVKPPKARPGPQATTAYRQYTRMKGDSRTIVERSKYLSSRISHMLLRINDLRARCAGQISVVYTLMNLRESLVNQKIANDSRYIAAAAKRDSSSMLGIALLTMVFLPATFISTLFSSPMFDWQAGRAETDQNVVSDRFWIFWVTSVPLTLFVLILYTLWMEYKGTGILRRKKASQDTPLVKNSN